MMLAAIAILGLASALACLLRRRPIDAALVLLAAAALGALAAGPVLPGLVPATIERIDGDGLRASQWNDRPARAMAWTVPATDTLRLAFPSELSLGRMFTLTVKRSHPQPARLQLLAENGQVIADAAGSGDLSVQWLPPVAEKLLLRARLLGAGGKVIDEGPVPVVVHENVPLKVQGRFGAPSFDVRALEEQLVASHAALDWQVTLGKAVTRTDAAQTLDAPDLGVIDAAWFEHAPADARAALLARVAAGMPLVILAETASDTGLWAQALQLPLRAQPEGKTVGGVLALVAPPFNPPAAIAGPWQALDGVVWTRPYKQGRIAWLGAADWHRHAITQPQALAAWWQAVLDRAGVVRTQDVAWLAPDDLPLPHERLELCAQGVKGEAVFAQLGQTLAWQRRPERADAACVAVWPRQSGWLHVHTGGADHAVYVYAAQDWTQWQRAQRRDATARYLARAPAARADATRTPLPAWPFALVFALAMLALWWRERR